MSDRLSFPRAELRRRTLRGTVVTAGFLVLIDGLVLIQGLIVTRLLGPRQIGLYGVVSTTVISLVALKRVGIDEAFVQQDEADQEREFHYAFTLELGLSLVMCLVIAALSPLIAAIYRDQQLLPLMLSLAYLPLAFALLSPMWVFFRRMDYRRQRSLQAIQPLVGFVVTVPLAAATNLGVWSIIIGQMAGYVAAITAAVAVSPYRLKLRYDRQTMKRYLRFSGPVFVTVVSAMVLAQGTILIIKLHDGLAAAGYITLAVTLTRYIDRADQIVTATIYPAICAIQGHTRALEEMYEKSNRATLLWVAPYAAGLVLFAPDLVQFVLARRGARPSPCSRDSRSSARSRSSGSTGSRSSARTATRARPPSRRSQPGSRSWRCAPPGCCSTASTGSCMRGSRSPWSRSRCVRHTRESCFPTPGTARSRSRCYCRSEPPPPQRSPCACCCGAAIARSPRRSASWRCSWPSTGSSCSVASGR